MIDERLIGGLHVRITDRGDDAVFQRFFDGYDRAFVLPSEKEDIDGLRACLALNHGAAYAGLEAKYGAFRELCLVADDPRGKPVGGANLIAMPIADNGGERLVSANLNYIYVDPESRGRGYLRLLVDAVKEIVSTFFAPADRRLPTIVFLEQNDPFRMSPAAYRRDSEFTGLDQIDRLRIWARLGARVVASHYLQPALVEGGEPDDTLILSAIGAQTAVIDAALLHAHLTRFFGISVLKGRPIESDPVATRLLHDLEARSARGEAIELRDPGPLLRQLHRREDALDLFGVMPTSFNDALDRAMV